MDSQEQGLQQAIAAAKAGDAGALHYLYVRYADDVRGYVASIVGSRDEADDVTQEVFLKLLRAIRHYQAQSVPFAAWLMRVARNSAIDHVRSRRQLPVAEVRAEAPAHDGADEARALHTALRELPDDQREVLVLRHVIGLSPGEIALRLRRTESSIHGLHHRGRRALQSALTEQGATPMTAVYN